MEGRQVGSSRSEEGVQVGDHVPSESREGQRIEGREVLRVGTLGEEMGGVERHSAGLSTRTQYQSIKKEVDVSQRELTREQRDLEKPRKS